MLKTHESPTSPLTGNPLLGGSALGGEGGGHPARSLSAEAEQPNPKHGPRHERERGLLFRALQWAGNRHWGYCLVRALGWGAYPSQGHGQEQAGDLHGRGRQPDKRRLDAPCFRAVYPSLCRAAACIALAAGSVGLAGCGLIPARIKADGVTVQGVRDAGKPATVAKSEAGVAVALPEGSKVTVTKYEAVAATDKAPAQPAKEVTEIQPNGPSEFHKTESRTDASTGTIDTSVATHKIDVAERRWLLWAAIGCGIGGVVVRSLVPAWPSLSNGLLMGAALAFAAWKLADIPEWIWLVALGIVGAMSLGYKRAEWDKNGDNIPDILQK